MMGTIQISLVFFGLFMMYVVRIHYKKKQIGRYEFGLWMLMWLTFIVVNIIPDSFKGIAQSLHVARVFDLLVIIALAILSLVSFQNRFHQKKIDNKIEEFIRRRAMNKKK
jgi:hypothetical protein